MKRSTFQSINFKYIPVFGEFDFELLYRSKQKGLTVKEIPSPYYYRTEGESAMGTGIDNALSLSKFALAYIKMAIKIRVKG